MRTFLGIDLPDEIKKNIKEVIEKLKKVKEARTVKLENLHITLKFLGDVEEKKIELIKEKLKSSFSDFPCFEVKLKGIGVFPEEKRVRVLWIGVEDNGILKKLNEKIERIMEKFGFEREKEFVSHITIARFKSVPNLNFIREFLEKHRDAVFGKFKIEDFFLYESFLTPEGPIYRKIERFILSKSWLNRVKELL